MDDYIELGELLDYEQPAKYIVSSEQYDDRFETPVLTAGKTFLLGYTNDENGIFKASKARPVILFDDFTTSSKWVDFDFKVKSSACKILIPKQGVDARFVYFALQKISVNTETHKRYWISVFSKIKVYYPEKETRERILSDLNDISNLIDINKKRISLYQELLDKKMSDYFGE